MSQKPPKHKSESETNPYEILILAAPFVIGGVILLLQRTAVNIINYGANPVSGRPSPLEGSYKDVIDPSMVHAIGAIGLLIGAGLTILYAYLFVQFRKKAAYPPYLSQRE